MVRRQTAPNLTRRPRKQLARASLPPLLSKLLSEHNVTHRRGAAFTGSPSPLRVLAEKRGHISAHMGSSPTFERPQFQQTRKVPCTICLVAALAAIAASAFFET
eukprot:3173719-Pleurochrysis_carterae.AAC.1